MLTASNFPGLLNASGQIIFPHKTLFFVVARQLYAMLRRSYVSLVRAAYQTVFLEWIQLIKIYDAGMGADPLISP